MLFYRIFHFNDKVLFDSPITLSALKNKDGINGDYLNGHFYILQCPFLMKWLCMPLNFSVSFASHCHYYSLISELSFWPQPLGRSSLQETKILSFKKKSILWELCYLFSKNTYRKIWRKEYQSVPILPNKFLLWLNFNEQFWKLLKQYVSLTRRADPYTLTDGYAIKILSESKVTGLSFWSILRIYFVRVGSIF